MTFLRLRFSASLILGMLIFVETGLPAVADDGAGSVNTRTVDENLQRVLQRPRLVQHRRRPFAQMHRAVKYAPDARQGDGRDRQRQHHLHQRKGAVPHGCVPGGELSTSVLMRKAWS